MVSFSDYGEVDRTWDSGTLSLYLSPDEVLLINKFSLVNFCIVFM